MENYIESDGEFTDSPDDAFQCTPNTTNDFTDDIQKELLNYQKKIDKEYVDKTVLDECMEYCKMITDMFHEQQINDIIINKTIENITIVVQQKNINMLYINLNNIKKECQMLSVCSDDTFFKYFRDRYDSLLLQYYNITIDPYMMTDKISEIYDQIGQYIETIADKIEEYESKKLVTVWELRGEI